MPVTSEIDPGGALLFGLMFGVPACIAAAYFGLKRWQHKASEGWPLVPAAYEGAGVDVWLLTQHGVSLYYVWLNFSYQVAGETYRGRYKKRLHGAESKGYADTLARSFEQGPLYVRHHPSRPRVYVMDPFRDVRPT